ncbi:MAG: SRPBCC family protein [Acidobacteriota bacterium]
MHINRQITIDAPIDQVWDVLGHRYDQVDRWASSVSHSAPSAVGQPLDGAPVAGRVCQTELGPFKESIFEYDENKNVLAYRASGSKMPFFVKDLRNRWSLNKVDDTRTEVDMAMSAELAFPFNLIMSLPMKTQFARVLDFAIEELKHYVETGNPHPRKVQADLAARAA